MEPIFSMKGIQDNLSIYEEKLTITPRGCLGFLNKGIKGTKTIPYSSITAIQFKEAGITNGYIQFSLLGGVENRSGIFAATKDENTFMFGAGKVRKGNAIKIRDYIESKIQLINMPSDNINPISLSDELEKLVRLKEKGILSEEEYEVAKAKLIDRL